VLRANALGDFIVILPALEALRAAYPQAEIVLLAKPWTVKFLAERPGPVDRVIPVPPYRGVGEAFDYENDPAVVDRFFEEMQQEKFDLAFQLHGGGRHSNPFVQRLGARITLGMKTPDAVPLDYYIPYFLMQPELVRYQEVVGLAGARPVCLEPGLAVIETDLAEARRVLPCGARPLVVIHPGASEFRRQWPPGKFAAVADALASAGAQIAVTGTPPEKEIVETVIGYMRTPALNLCGKLSLGGLAGLLSQCALLVSNDTGPLHLAQAVGAKTVGFYWWLNFLNWSPATRARHRPLLSGQINCPDCGQRLDAPITDCQHTSSSLVADITVQEALQAACELLCL
jgi:ADP-heptose:LPS heptosyltransferase